VGMGIEGFGVYSVDVGLRECAEKDGIDSSSGQKKMGICDVVAVWIDVVDVEALAFAVQVPR
jgi:hypothetical protein